MSGTRSADAAPDRVIAEACEAMLDALPQLRDCTHEFSPDFEAKMQKLSAKVRRREAALRHVRNAAAVFLVLLIGSGIFLGVNTEARAAFFGWVREVCENSIVYRYFGGHGAEAELPDVELTWLPEGYVEVETDKTETQYISIYQNIYNEDQIFIFAMQLMHDGTTTDYLFGDTEYIQKNVEVNKVQGNLFISCDETKTSELIWFDEDTGIAFQLSSYFDESVMLHIAENVVLSK